MEKCYYCNGTIHTNGIGCGHFICDSCISSRFVTTCELCGFGIRELLENQKFTKIKRKYWDRIENIINLFNSEPHHSGSSDMKEAEIRTIYDLCFSEIFEVLVKNKLRHRDLANSIEDSLKHIEEDNLIISEAGRQIKPAKRY